MVHENGHGGLFIPDRAKDFAEEMMLFYTTVLPEFYSTRKNLYYIVLYCILRGQIKGFNRSITTIMCEDGSYRTVVGQCFK